jgi:hypothetical protein
MVIVPVDLPVTTPLAFTVATFTLLLDHDPPDTLAVNVIVLSFSTLLDPEMVPASGIGFTVTLISLRVALSHPVAVFLNATQYEVVELIVPVV